MLHIYPYITLNFLYVFFICLPLTFFNIMFLYLFILIHLCKSKWIDFHFSADLLHEFVFPFSCW